MTPNPFQFGARPLGRRVTAALLATAVPAVTLAHPGEHGSDWLHAALHLLSEPDHLAAIGIALVLAFWGVGRLVRWRRARQSVTGR